MNDLYDGTQADGAAPVTIEEFRGKQQQGRTQTFSATGAKVLANFGDHLHVRNGVTAELAFNRRKVIP